MFRERGAEILGVSPDDVASHGKFKSKYELPFTLLADPEHEVAEKYGVWGERIRTARRAWASSARRFIIDSDGNVARAMMGIKPAGHASEVLDSLNRQVHPAEGRTVLGRVIPADRRDGTLR